MLKHRWIKHANFELIYFRYFSSFIIEIKSFFYFKDDQVIKIHLSIGNS